MILSNSSELTKGSHTKVTIECDFKVANKCRKIYQQAYKDYLRYNKDNGGKDICLYCSRKIKSSGRNNGNCKYDDIDDNFFQDINSEEKAYLLGWIASDGSVSKCGFTISIHKKDERCLKTLRSILSNKVNIKSCRNGTMVSLTINSQKIASDICKWLKINPGKKSDIVRFPNVSNDDLKWSFLRGYFDGDGSIRTPTYKHRNPSCDISSNSSQMLNEIKNFCNIPCKVTNNRIYWHGNNSLDFLGKLYNNSKLYLDRKYELYQCWAQYIPIVKKGCTVDNIIGLQYCDKNGVKPSKQRVSDSGYDVTLIRKIKEENGIEYYGTGIKVCPSYGYFFLLAPRSSMPKTGYILANNIGIIDRTYLGELIVALIKFNKDAPNLESQLPIKMVQLIPQQVVHFEIVEVEELGESDRGSKGFGSSGR